MESRDVKFGNWQSLSDVLVGLEGFDMYIDIHGICEGGFDLDLVVDESSSKCKYSRSQQLFIIDQWGKQLFGLKKIVSGEKKVTLTILTK
jgi:hypothetical protein